MIDTLVIGILLAMAYSMLLACVIVGLWLWLWKPKEGSSEKTTDET